jgi:hypothetical protein
LVHTGYTYNIYIIKELLVGSIRPTGYLKYFYSSVVEQPNKIFSNSLLEHLSGTLLNKCYIYFSAIF